jgi:hypothetical protein
MSVDPDFTALDLEPIAYKVCTDEGWDLAEIDVAELEYRALLHAVRHYPGVELAPSKRVDVFWHHHILDTEKYIADCHRLFGRYIHHYPYSGLLGDNDARQQEERFLRTQALLEHILLS